jgi:hypothetical protein
LNAWQRLGLCDEQQYAFLKGRSTAVQPAMIKRLVLEQAAAKGTPLAMVDIVTLAKHMILRTSL